jgi:hypothetical protein
MKQKAVELPHRHLKQLLPGFLERIEIRLREQPERILEGWYDIIDPQWKGLTQSDVFEKGIVVIKVKNAALYSLIVQQKKEELLKKLQEKFPTSGIKNLKFRIG